MVNRRYLDFNGESFDQRLARFPEMLTRKHLISLRLFDTLECVNFAIKRGKVPYVKRGQLIHFPKAEIKKWLKNRD